MRTLSFYGLIINEFCAHCYIHGNEKQQIFISKLSRGYDTLINEMLKALLTYFKKKSESLNSISASPHLLSPTLPGDASHSKDSNISLNVGVKLQEHPVRPSVKLLQPVIDNPIRGSALEIPRKSANSTSFNLGNLSNRENDTSQLHNDARKVSFLNESSHSSRKPIEKVENHVASRLEAADGGLGGDAPEMTDQIDGDEPKQKEEVQAEKELEDLLKRKEMLLERVQATGSASHLKQILRNLASTKRRQAQLNINISALEDDEEENLDFDSLQDTVLGAYAGAQRKTATRVLKYVEKNQRFKRDGLYQQVMQNSVGTDPDYKMLEEAKKKLVKAKDEEYKKIVYTLEQENANLKARVTDLQERLGEATQDLLTAKALSADEYLAQVELEKQVRKLKTDNASLEEKVHRKKEKIKELKEMLSGHSSESKGKGGQIDYLVARNNGLSEENKKLKGTCSDLQKEIQELKQQLQELEELHIKEEKREVTNEKQLATLRIQDSRVALSKEESIREKTIDEVFSKNKQPQSQQQLQQEESLDAANENSRVEVPKKSSVLKKDGVSSKKSEEPLKKQLQSQLQAQPQAQKSSLKKNSFIANPNSKMSKNRALATLVMEQQNSLKASTDVKKFPREKGKLHQSALIQNAPTGSKDTLKSSNGSLDELGSIEEDAETHRKDIETSENRSVEAKSYQNTQSSHIRIEGPRGDYSQTSTLNNIAFNTESTETAVQTDDCLILEFSKSHDAVPSQKIAAFLNSTQITINQLQEYINNHSSSVDYSQSLLISNSHQTFTNQKSLDNVLQIPAKTYVENAEMLANKARSTRNLSLNFAAHDNSKSIPSNNRVSTNLSTTSHQWNSGLSMSMRNLLSPRGMKLDKLSKTNSISDLQASHSTSFRATRGLMSPQSRYTKLASRIENSSFTARGADEDNSLSFRQRKVKFSPIGAHFPKGSVEYNSATINLSASDSQREGSMINELERATQNSLHPKQRQFLTDHNNFTVEQQAGEQKSHLLNYDKIQEQIKAREEKELEDVFNTLQEKALTAPRIKNLFKDCVRRKNPSINPQDLEEGKFEVDFEAFKEYMIIFKETHRKCGEDCPHLKRFYEKLGYASSRLKKRGYLSLPVTDIERLPKIIPKIHLS